MNRFLILVFFGCVGCYPASAQRIQDAQQLDRELAATAVYDNGEVRLRWATSNTIVWNLIRSNGVILRRQESNQPDSTVMNNGQPLRVYPESRWEQMASTTRSAAAVATLLRPGPDYPSTIYASAQQEENKLTSLLILAEYSFPVAQGLALAYIDDSAQPGMIYRYEVILPDPIAGDTLYAEAIVSTEYEEPIPQIINLEATPGDSLIGLSWVQMDAHAGYFVERKSGRETSWQALNQTPLILEYGREQRFFFRDSVANYIPNQYRVRAFDTFGRMTPYSAPAETFARDLTAPEPPLGVKALVVNGQVVINWTNPETTDDLVGYGLLRSPDPDEGYRPIHEELLSPSTTSYSEPLPGRGSFFYRLVAADTARNVSAMSVRSMIVIRDSIPPPPPANLVAVADTMGIVRLSWDHVRLNDVAGYRTYRRLNGPQGPEFVLLTGSIQIDSTFSDTLLATVRDPFTYHVRAIDFAGNVSEPSEFATIQFPDIYPPAAPVFTDHSVADERVRLEYVSASRDVERYRVYRGIDGQTPAQVVESGDLTWDDRDTEHKKTYRYYVTAIDSAGNVSEPSRTIIAKPYWRRSLTAPTAPQLSFDSTSGKVATAWSYPGEDDGWSAVVFRRKSGTDRFDQVSPRLTTNRYEDELFDNGAYEYALRFYFSDQGGTPMGEASLISVTLPGNR